MGSVPGSATASDDWVSELSRFIGELGSDLFGVALWGLLIFRILVVAANAFSSSVASLKDCFGIS